MGERGTGLFRVRTLPGGASLPWLPHQERQHGLLGRGGGGSDDGHGKRQGSYPVLLDRGDDHTIILQSTTNTIATIVGACRYGTRVRI